MTLKTNTVDASPFLKKKLKGFKERLREWYWGFGAKEFPLNGRVFFPGHSRGGEAITHAAGFNKLARFPDDANIRFDFHFSIKSLIAIAPVDWQYEPADQPVPLENVNYLVLQGSHDSQLSYFTEFRHYRRVKFTDGQY